MKVSRQEIAALSEEIRRRDHDYANFKDGMQKNCDMLIEEIAKRDEDIKYKANEIAYLTTKMDEVGQIFHENLAISAEQLNKLTIVNQQNAELREIIVFR
jgi:hypothetical protein